MTTRRTRVLIIDDSAVVRQVLAQVLQRDPAIDVIGAAQDPIFAMERMQRDWPDVIVLDVEMPRMDGITFLKKLMAARPTPVVICSTLTSKGAETTMQALAAGAVGIVAKPTTGLRGFLQEDGGGIVGAVKAAAAADMRRAKTAAARPAAASVEWPAAREPAGAALSRTTDRLVAIGTSTGGTQALEAVLTQLPRVAPGIVIVQHMPEKFTAAFAARLDSLCQIEVAEAKQGDRVVPGRALIAPGGRHMTVRLCGAQYHVDITDGPLVSHHRPSVDVLFRSVAKSAGRNALGIIMTGMGDDGARGLKEMRDAGARTCAQDEKSCVVYGMPREAVRLGGVQQEVPLAGIATVIDRYGQESMALQPG